MPKNQDLLDQKCTQIEKELDEWLREKDLLGPGESVAVTVFVRRQAIASVRAHEESLVSPQLPKDENLDNTRRKTFSLSEDDWDKLEKATRNNAPFLAVIQHLRENKNGPISSAEIESVSGKESGQRFSLRMHHLLKRAGDYDTVERKGSYYKFIAIKPGWYAVFRFGYI